MSQIQEFTGRAERAGGTPLSVGEIDMGRMIRIGIFATIVFAMVTATIHLLLSPFV